MSRLGQRESARMPQEERRSQPVLQQLHLIADGRLRHPELGGGTGEAQLAGGGLEDADGGEGGELVGHVWHKVSLCRLSEIELESEPRQCHLQASKEPKEAAMLYDNRKVGRISAWLALSDLWRTMTHRPHKADLDLRHLSPYLRRDLGLTDDVTRLLPGYIERK